MAIRKEILHPENDDSIDIYPKTSYDQIEGTPDLSDYQEKDELEQDIEELGFEKVKGNPTESGSVNLTKIKIGDTVYLIPEGTVVEGNPTETGSDNLTKIKIGDTVYNIPSGGGGNTYLHRLFFADNATYVYFKTNFSTPITPQNATTLFGLDAYNDWCVFANAVGEIPQTGVIPYLYSFLGNDAILYFGNSQLSSWLDTVTEI